MFRVHEYPANHAGSFLAGFSGFVSLANYTFSKNLSDAPDFRSPMFESAAPQDNSNLRRKRDSPAMCVIVSL
jgi:hypothetical protein